MADTNTVLTRLLTALSITDPTWDTSVGSTLYKIMESVAQEISNTANNSTLLTYGLDVNSKNGSELDAFVYLFGINRQLGSRSSGTVTFSVQTLASQNYSIPQGTQVYAPNSIFAANINFSTVAPTVLTSGSTSVVVPVVASVAGAFGNVPAGSITLSTTPLVGITNLVNENPLTGGQDAETDAQLRQRFLATAFSNFSGTLEKYFSIAQQDPNVSQVNVIGPDLNYLENLNILTLVSGNSNFILGLNTQSSLIVASGATTASAYLGQLQPNVTLPANGAGVFSGTVVYDGTNYNLSSATTNSGIININYTVSGTSPTVLNGSSTQANVVTVLSGLLNGPTLNYGNSITVTTTGTSNVIASGLQVSFSQNIPWNVVLVSGSGPTVVNGITSQIPDSKYCYPQGNEVVGYNLGTVSQGIFTPNVDYTYIQATGTAPLSLKINFIPSVNNAPYTYTGASVQLQSVFTPISSRVTVTGNNIVNPNFIDIYINDTTTSTVTEQVMLVSGNTITNSGSGKVFSADKFVLANGNIVPSGSYYININQQPIANFPYQLISGNGPSYVTFNNFNFPIALGDVSTPITIAASGLAGANTLTTSTSISGLSLGLVASGMLGAVANISGIGVGNYITGLVPGNPNKILLSNNLTSQVSGTIGWVSVAYPVYDATNYAGSIQDATGFVIKATDPTGSYQTSYPVTAGSIAGSFTFDYYLNVVSLDNLSQQSRVVGSNVLAHQAQYLNLIVNLSVFYGNSTSPSVTNSAIQTAIVSYFNSVSFGGTVSLSNLLSRLYGISGVSGARISTATDNPNNYGLQSVNRDGSVIAIFTKDILLNSNQLPLLYKINFTTFGQNNF